MPMPRVEDDYPYIVKDVMEYIVEVKKEDEDSSLLDIIYDYCFKNNLEVEMVGDAIRSDVYFKSFIEKDCATRNIIKSDKYNKKSEW